MHLDLHNKFPRDFMNVHTSFPVVYTNCLVENFLDMNSKIYSQFQATDS